MTISSAAVEEEEEEEEKKTEEKEFRNGEIIKESPLAPSTRIHHQRYRVGAAAREQGPAVSTGGYAPSFIECLLRAPAA